MSKRDRSGARVGINEMMSLPPQRKTHNPVGARKSKQRSATHRASPCRTIQGSSMLTLTGVMQTQPLSIGAPETNEQTVQMRRNHLMGF